jgi:anaerobic dimethyl sulfoxide reductase subunit A
MAHVILTENLYDKKFLDTYCLGFDEEHMPEGIQDGESLVSYLLGKKDGIPKTPEWAEKICRAPANKIRQLAREYALAKPAALIQGWGPQRHACGERTARGGTMLACITGNVGILGGWASGYGGIELKFPKSIPIPDDPVSAQIPITAFLDAITNAKGIKKTDGLKGTDQLASNIKLIFNLAGNYLANQNCDINKTVKVLEDERLVEFIVVSDIFMTPSAKYADILLPANTFFEQWNLGKNWHWGDYFILSEKVVENYFESRVDYEWLAAVAKKLGVGEQFTEGRDERGWVQYLLEETRKEDLSVPTFEELQKTRIHRWRHLEPRVAFQKEIEDPANYPFKTPSGKIELFSKTLYEMKDSEIPALPIYVPSWEGPEDTLAQKYPLQLIGWKTKQRANSCFNNHPWLNEMAQSKMWINPIDAQKRKLKNGEKVKVFNDRGALVVDIEITHRIIPGVVAIPTGAWWSPDKNGIDQNGCINVLTTTRKTALAHGNAHHTNLVQVEKL